MEREIVYTLKDLETVFAMEYTKCPVCGAIKLINKYFKEGLS